MTNESGPASGIIHRTNMTPAELGCCCAANAQAMHEGNLRDLLFDVARVLATNEGGIRPITMQDVRLAVGEGPLKPADVLAGCNAELVRRKALISPAGEVGSDEPILGLSADPRGMEG